ncbi:hypothetical protein C8R46DRAFT_1108193 [Mycena filopes]|nr:hypothetical protein C8R46DRAFT_1108193 [Mycena filopes]
MSSNSSGSKRVRWKLTVDEYAERGDTPESWTAPLPPTSRRTIPAPPSLSSGRGQPRFVLHPALTPADALQLDLSFPSVEFRANPQLTQSLLDSPACHPPRTTLTIHIAAGAFDKSVIVKHTHGEVGQPVTLGDVLTKIQNELRQYDNNQGPPEARLYMERRIETVNGYCDRRDRRVEAEKVKAERQGPGRFVDHLFGQTQFAGLTVQQGKPDDHWELQLAVPLRYKFKN